MGFSVSDPEQVEKASEYVEELARIAGSSQSPRTIKRAANLMAAMARGDVPAAPLVAAPPDFFRWVPVWNVLSNQPGWSGPRARRVLRLLSIDSNRSLDVLSETQRQILARSLRTRDSALS